MFWWVERVVWHPLWLWAAVGVVSAPPLYALLREVVWHRITALEFGLGLTVVFSIWAAIEAFWGEPAGLVLLVYLVLAAVYVVVTCNRIARISDRPVMERELQRAEAAARRDPSNAAAKAYMGELYLRMGNAEEALRQFGEATRLSPQPYYESRLREAGQALRASQGGEVRCRVCGSMNPAGAMLCKKCGGSVAGFGFVSERVGLTYLGRPRWSAGLMVVPVAALSVLAGGLHPLLALAIMGGVSVALVVRLGKIVRGQA